MIELEHITKRYGKLTALEDVSFRAPEGKIIGLLGRNGAGKTTTLNVMTGFFPPTEGRVLINGVDMMQNPRECKRHIGYLPENPPLYDEMTVEEYLTFVCELREVEKKDIAPHCKEIMELCGLTERRTQLLGTLSRGFRQRVGIAQALCGSPEVLILDEPTVGLDPQQVAEIRELIRKLGKDHTVLFSSHLLSEVQQLCQQVVILHKGKLIRIFDTEHLGTDDSRIRLHLTLLPGESHPVQALQSLECVQRVKELPVRNAGLVELELVCGRDGENDPRVRIFRLMAALDCPILSMQPVQDSLEEVFLRETED